MLEAEVTALRRASSAQHVVHLHEVIVTADAVWLAMDRVPGCELFVLIEERGPLSLQLACSLVEQTLSALSALEALGVVRESGTPTRGLARVPKGVGWWWRLMAR